MGPLRLRGPGGAPGTGALLLLFALGGALGAVSSARAMPTQTAGSGTAVTSVDRSASFDGVSNNDPLGAYTENDLSITVPDTAILLSDDAWGGTLDGGHHAPFAGVTAATILTTTDAVAIRAIEFRIASGWSTGDALVHIDWQTWSGATLTGSGNVDLARGSVIGFQDPDGFDELHIGAYQFDFRAVGGIDAGQIQALGVDDVQVQLVPEPATGLLLAAGLVGLARRARPGRGC